MDKNDLELRMFGFVPYNISEIQKGIQFGHGVVEYSILLGDTKLYKKWATDWKTFIILNGGTSNNGHSIFPKGSMEILNISLLQNGIRFSKFHEPDLNFMLSSLNFIVDERVFNREKYPDYKINSEYNAIIYNELKNFSIEMIMKDFLESRVYPIISDKSELQDFKEWIEFIGGIENLYLRIILLKYKLA